MSELHFETIQWEQMRGKNSGQDGLLNSMADIGYHQVSPTCVRSVEGLKPMLG